MSEKTFIHILDSTLRDGSHALSHQFTAEHVARVAKGLDDAGVEIIEVSHGDGLGSSTITYGLSKQSEFELLKAAGPVIKKGKLAVLLLPGIGTKDDLKMAADFGAKVAQIATHVTEADIAEQHIGVAKKMGMEVIAMLMLSHMGSPEKIAEQGKLMESFGADVVQVTDSAGALIPQTAKDRVEALRSKSASLFTVTTIYPLPLPTVLPRSKRERVGSTPALAVLAPVPAIRRPRFWRRFWIRWATPRGLTCGRSWMLPRRLCGPLCKSRCASAKQVSPWAMRESIRASYSTRTRPPSNSALMLEIFWLKLENAKRWAARKI